MNGNIKYYLAYDTPIGTINGKVNRRVGRQEIHGMSYDKEFSLGVAEALCDVYGRGTHWIEDETGEKVEDID